MKDDDIENPVILPPEDGSLKRFMPEIRGKFSMKNTFAALKYSNYRLWFWGQMISLFGSWMQTTALAFFIFELTKSPAYLGYVGFASGVPAWFFSFYGGVAADRMSRKKILLYTQSAMMLLAIFLAVLTFTNLILPWHLLVLAFLQGIAVAFDAPTRHALVNELVDKEELGNAIALNSTMFNTATAIGPALGGITYAIFGPAWCFTINGISFIAVIVNLMRMRLKPLVIPQNTHSTLHQFVEGITYLKSRKEILAILSITTLVSVFGMGLVTLFPAWAVDILHGNSTTNGFLQSARGLGAVIFALIIATIYKYIKRGKYLLMSALTLPVLIFIFSFNRSLIISILLLVLIGGIIIMHFNLANGMIQTIVDEQFRGRIMSFYTFTFFALFPIGSLWIGSIAEHFGSPAAIMINSIILFICVVGIRLLYPKLLKIK
ncbi:MAG: MFS transporter [bacterium]